ncbi:MAG: 2Fe-2S iron-sulfur cluster-binding protein [Syntrophales bacterium]|nr:2Fe-2S iron-sulfur cluster-binding protein [Syntrophales bacterium]
MKTVHLHIDGREVETLVGSKILWAALDNGVYIPNLCAIRERGEPFASCRLCFVEVEGRERPVTACTTSVTEGMVVDTKGSKALRLARTAFELILSNHLLDCAHCPKKGSCELHRIARHLGVKLNTERFRKVLRDLPVDTSSPVFTYIPDKCVLCGRCVWVCEEKLGVGAIGFAYRGFQRRVTTFGDEPLSVSGCQTCIECVDVCPVGALVPKEGGQAFVLTES